MALGASPGQMGMMIARQIVLMTVVGGGIGFVGALWIGRISASLLFGLQGHDPGVLTVSLLTMTAVAAAAGAIPARRAMRIDPMSALRSD